jgi:hypothetical protein
VLNLLRNLVMFVVKMLLSCYKLVLFAAKMLQWCYKLVTFAVKMLLLNCFFRK